MVAYRRLGSNSSIGLPLGVVEQDLACPGLRRRRLYGKGLPPCATLRGKEEDKRQFNVHLQPALIRPAKHTAADQHASMSGRSQTPHLPGVGSRPCPLAAWIRPGTTPKRASGSPPASQDSAT